MNINKKKRYLQHYSKGVELLGYKLRFGRILPSDRVCHNLRWYLERTIRRATENSGYVVAYIDEIRDSLNSYLGMLRHMDAYKLRRWICKTVVTSPIGAVFSHSPDYTKVIIKPEFTTKAYYRREYKSLKQHLKFNIL